MTTNEIAVALTNATETEKAEFAQYLLEALHPEGLEDDSATKRQIVAAFDRFAEDRPAVEPTRREREDR